MRVLGLLVLGAVLSVWLCVADRALAGENGVDAAAATVAGDAAGSGAADASAGDASAGDAMAAVPAEVAALTATARQVRALVEDTLAAAAEPAALFPADLADGFLVLVRWWRDVVFARLALLRKPNRYERWGLDHKTGWASFLAAATGGLYLFATGSYRAVRSWVARFEITRKAMAYLFRRKLDRLGAEKAAEKTAPLPPAAFDALGPDAAEATEWVPTPSDEALVTLAARVKERRGGLVALVGERAWARRARSASSAGSRPSSASTSRTPFETDVHIRVRKAFRKHGILPPAVLHRTFQVADPSFVDPLPPRAAGATREPG